jgi:predicted TIM-barrel fold metal-dependent hydrolase
VDALQSMLARHGLDRVVIVQASVYGDDNSCLLDALAKQASPSRGVIKLPANASRKDFEEYHRLGVRGVRLNWGAARTPPLEQARSMLLSAGKQVAEHGWHVQIFASTPMLSALKSTIDQSPVPIVIDHFGAVESEPVGIAGDVVCSLLDTGKVWAKLSAPYRLSQYSDQRSIQSLTSRFLAANPQRLVWGSDWPHTASHGKTLVESDREVPFRNIDLDALLHEVRLGLHDETAIHRVFVDNPAALYDF